MYFASLKEKYGEFSTKRESLDSKVTTEESAAKEKEKMYMDIVGCLFYCPYTILSRNLYLYVNYFHEYIQNYEEGAINE